MQGRILLWTAFCAWACLSVILPGCAGTPSPGSSAVNGPKTEIQQKEPPVVTEARRLIRFGTPESIREGVEALSGSPAINSQAGERLAFAGWAIHTLVYPLIDFPLEVREPEEGDQLLALYRDAERGEFSPYLESWDVFLEIIITSLAVLAGDDPDILTLGGLAARSALVQDVESVLPSYVLGVVAEKEGRFDDAISRYTDALVTGESCYPARVGLARILTGLERYEAALEQLDVLTEEFPRNQGFAFSRAEILTTLGRNDEVRKAVEVIEERFGGDVDRSRILLLEARRLLGMNKPREALSVLEPVAESKTALPDVLAAAGRAAAGAGELETAVRYLRRAVDAGDGSSKTRELLFRTAVNAGMYDRALPLADEVLESTSSRAARFAAARLFLETGAVTESLEFSGPLYEENPDNPEYLLTYIRGLMLANRGGEALPIIERGLEFIRDRQIRSTLHYLAGRLYESRDRRIEAFQAALFENMSNSSALIALSDEFAAIGEYLKAYRYMTQAQALLPDNQSVSLRVEELEALIE